MPKTTTFYIKCSAEEAAAIRAVAKGQQRTVHNYLRFIAITDILKTDISLLYPPLKCELCDVPMPMRTFPPTMRADGYALNHPKNSCGHSGKWFAWPEKPWDGRCPGLVELFVKRTSA